MARKLKTHSKWFAKGRSECGLIGLGPERFAKPGEKPTCGRCLHLIGLTEKYRREFEERYPEESAP